VPLAAGLDDRQLPFRRTLNPQPRSKVVRITRLPAAAKDPHSSQIAAPKEDVAKKKTSVKLVLEVAHAYRAGASS
jgi:hypothetical protein